MAVVSKGSDVRHPETASRSVVSLEMNVSEERACSPGSVDRLQGFSPITRVESGGKVGPPI